MLSKRNSLVLVLVLLSVLSVSPFVQAQGMLGLVSDNQQEQQAEETVSTDSEDSPVPCAGEDCKQAPGSEKQIPIQLNVDEVVNVEKLTADWDERLNKWLSSMGFENKNSVNIAASILVTLVASILLILVSVGVRKIYQRIVSKKDHLEFSKTRMKVYRRVIIILLDSLILLFSVITVFSIWWGVSSDVHIINRSIQWFGLVLQLFLAILILFAIFEVISAAAESYMSRLAKTGGARVNTILPIARSAIYVFLIVLIGIILIAEMGINVTPILASAGVVGLAVGFAAQTLIKDYLNGFILVLEDLISVGDIVTLGDRSGLVEKITLRKVQLRDLDGCVYTIPCSEITVVKNFTKVYSYYLFDVGVAYRENTDEVCEVLRSISDDMRSDEKYADSILDSIEILGVDQFADSAVVIKARIKTVPMQRWVVGREFNRRMKYAFDDRNIEIPFPHQTLYFGEDKQGGAPVAHVEFTEAKGAANDQASAPSSKE